MPGQACLTDCLKIATGSSNKTRWARRAEAAVDGYIQFIMGATLKRLDSAGREFSGLEWVFCTILLWRMSKEGGGVLPQTAGHDLAHLGAVLSIARPAWGYEVDTHAMADARKVLSTLGYNMKAVSATGGL